MPAALLLVWRAGGLRPGTAERFERVAAAMPRRVRELATDGAAAPALRLRTWSHPTSVGSAPAIAADGSWLTAVGNPTRGDLSGLNGDALLARLLRESRGSSDRTAAGLSPPFALLHWDAPHEVLSVAVDRCGLQHLYVREDPDGTVWIGSSSLALARALGGTVDDAALAEWLAAGHFVSGRTFVREVRKLGAGERLRLDGAGCAQAGPWTGGGSAGATEHDYRAALEDALSASHGGGDCAAELTGGLDSRALLAGRLAHRLPGPSWTVGDPASAELLTVERLRRAAGFEHIAIPLGPVLGAAIPDLAREMHELSDGEVNALEYAPLLVAFAALDGRRTTSVSGSGGEIARGYYWSAIRGGRGVRRRVDVGALAAKLAAATAPALAAVSPDAVPDPTAPLRTAAEAVLAASAASTPEGLLDDFYVRARMQRFAGRNVTTTGLFCRQALPYFDDRVVDAALALAPEHRRRGGPLRGALAGWAPELARIPLADGTAVAAPSWRAPAAGARWAAAMGRKALLRHGGRAGRALAAAPPGPVPWDAVRTSPAFRNLVGDLLPPAGARVHRLLDPARTEALVRRSLAGGSLYPLGLVLTLELTLRRLDPTG